MAAADGGPAMPIMSTRYLAVTPERVQQLMAQAGFHDVRRLDDRFYQPVLVGTKPPVT